MSKIRDGTDEDTETQIVYRVTYVKGSTLKRGRRIMRKKFVLTDLCCANCALKIEEGIKKLPGVKDISVSFITSKMILEAEEDQFDTVFAEAVKIVKKIEPDCEVLAK